MVWKNTALLRLFLCSAFKLGSVFTLCQGLFGQSRVISERVCYYVLLYAVILINWWHYYKLISCWNKWRALRFLCVSRLESSWDGPVYIAATFPATILSHHESLVKTGLQRESDNNNNNNKHELDQNKEGRVLLSDFHELPTLALTYCIYWW